MNSGLKHSPAMKRERSAIVTGSVSCLDQRLEENLRQRDNTATFPSSSRTNALKLPVGMSSSSSSSPRMPERHSPTKGTKPAPRTNLTPEKRRRTAVVTTCPFSFSAIITQATRLSKSSGAHFATARGVALSLKPSGMSNTIAFHSAIAPAKTRFVLEPSGNVASTLPRREIFSPLRSDGTNTRPSIAKPSASISLLPPSSS